MRVKLVVASTLATVAGVTGLAIAQAPEKADGYSKSDILLERIYTGVVLASYLATELAPLRAADRDNDGLDRGDVILATEQSQAEARASNIEHLLRHDLNGDLRVPRAEMIRATKVDVEARNRWVDQQFQDMDANGDEVITVTEAAASAQDRPVGEALETLLALDPSGDGRLTADELRRLAEQAFNGVDSDRDGKISADERRAIDARVQHIQIIRAAPVCDLPAAAAQAKIVVFGGYEGDSIASVAIGGPDQETNLIDVEIEPGATPVYVVLTSYESMVWRLTGATGRVSNVIVASGQSVRTKPGLERPVGGGKIVSGGRIARPEVTSFRGMVSASGVVGIPARKVTIVRPSCLQYFSGSDGRSTRVIRETLRRALGREADAVFGQYSIQRIALPSGKVTNAVKTETAVPRGFDLLMWQEAVRFWPGGLVAVDPRRVVARTTVEPYQVLPSQMGLAQLVGSGELKRESNDKFLIVRPIPHLPPSMGGAHSVTLKLPPGIPLPPGDPVHSCVITADGKAQGANCR